MNSSMAFWTASSGMGRGLSKPSSALQSYWNCALQHGLFSVRLPGWVQGVLETETHSHAHVAEAQVSVAAHLPLLGEQVEFAAVFADGALLRAGGFGGVVYLGAALEAAEGTHYY